VSAVPALPLPRRQLLAYGAFGLPLAMAALPVYVHVPRLYAEVSGMSLSLLGALLLAARLLDAGIDPLLGGWSDRTASRRRLIVVALPCLALGMLALLHPPAVAAPLWLLASLLGTYFGFSLATVAYQAWGAELGRDAGERTRLTASREGFGLLGVVLAAALPGLIANDLAQGLSLLAQIFPLVVAAARQLDLPRYAVVGGAAASDRQGFRRPAAGCSTMAVFGACWRSSWSMALPPHCRRRWSFSSSPMCCTPKPGAALFSPFTSSAALLSCRCG
jgi:GPH family glycoside/pentoside/hexuronide:cation symporter